MGNVLSNWLPTTNPCSGWIGVTCTGGSVTALCARQPAACAILTHCSAAPLLMLSCLPRILWPYMLGADNRPVYSDKLICVMCSEVDVQSAVQTACAGLHDILHFCRP